MGDESVEGRISKLESENARLRAELRQAAKERDDYRRALMAIFAQNPPPPLTEEQMQQMERDGLTIDDIIEELEAQVATERVGRGG